MARCLHIVLFACLWSLRCLAASDSVSLMHFTTQDGLPSNNVYMLTQDKNGYLWFATDKGLAKYDGYSFRIFNRSDGLPSNDIWSVCEDKNGRIFPLSNSHYLGYIMGDVYKKLNIPYVERFATTYGKAGNNLYFGVQSQRKYELIKLNGDSVNLFEFNNELAYKLSPQSPKWNIFLELESNKIIICFQDTVYLYRLTDPFWRPKKLPLNFYLLNHVNFYQNRIYFSGNDNTHIKTFDLADGSYQSMDISKITGDRELIYSGFPIKDTFFLFTDKNVYTLSAKSKIHRDNVPRAIPDSGQFTYRFRDSNNNLWYCLKQKGVWSVRHTPNVLDKNSWLTMPVTAGFVGKIREGTIFWDKDSYSMFLVGNDKHVRKFRWPDNGALESVYQRDSVIWLGFTYGTFQFNPQTGVLKNIFDGYHVFTYNIPYRVKNGGIYEIPDSMKRRLNLDYCNSVCQYADTGVILLHATGINDIRFHHDSLLIYSFEFQKFTRSLYNRNSGILILYNADDVALFNVKNKRVFKLSNAILSSLNIVNISDIQLANDGNYYAFFNGHIAAFTQAFRFIGFLHTGLNLENARIDISDDIVTIAGPFGVTIGRLGYNLPIRSQHTWINERRQFYTQVNYVVADSSGNIIVGTEHGIKIARIDAILKNSTLTSNAGVFKLILKFPWGDKNVISKDTFIIPQSMSIVELGTINFTGAGIPAFNYYIPGTGDHWQKTSTGTLSVTKLTPGYHQVICSIEDDFWQGDPISFFIYIPPYWYQTTTWKIIFWILGFIALGLVVLVSVLITRHYVARANERKRVLTELELRAVYSQINPHFIFNTLSSVQYFINKKNFDDAYLHVNKFSRLLRAYLKSSQDRYITLSEEIKMLTNYIELQKTRFETKFDYEITVDNKLPADNIMIPSLLLQPLVENAINHGLFHKQGHGWLSVRFAQGADSSEVICTIEDNGVGRLKAKQINDENTTKRESYGTKLTQQLINIFNEFEHMDIHLDYTDKEAPDTGTIVTLTIKNIKYVA